MKQVRPIVWGIAIIALGVIFGGNALGWFSLNIFFDGWWTLFIIIPSVISLVTEKEKLSSLGFLAAGVILLLAAQNVFSYENLSFEEERKENKTGTGYAFSKEEKDMAAYTKRFLAMLIAVSLCLGAAPSAFAAVQTETDTKTEGGITLFNLSGIDSNELSYLLDKKGVCVRGGLHCAPSAHRKIGTLDSGAVRLSFSIMNSEKEVDEFLSIMESIANKHAK